MAYFYMDTDGAGATAPYDTWAKAAQDLETVLAAMSAGDILYVQGAATDTAAASRTLTVPGTLTNPNLIIGVKDGTTNTGTSVVASDLIVRGTDTLVKIECTGAASDLIFDDGFATWYGIEFDIGDQMNCVSKTFKHMFVDCKFTLPDDLILNGVGMDMVFVNCDWNPEVVGVEIRAISGARVTFFGGVLSAPVTNLLRSDSYDCTFRAFDLTLLGNNKLQNVTSAAGENRFINCKTPATYTVTTGTPTNSKYAMELIGCNSGSSLSNTSSYQDYYYKDAHGVIQDEATIVRTGGADDGAAGAFSYAMTATADAVLESSVSNLESPWMMAWIEGGASKTCTVYIANSSAATDYNEDEVWCEFYTPDDGDTAQHDMTFDPALPRLLASSTAITDDTGSTWGAGGNNHQKFSMTTTPGFEGFVYARIHLAKRQAVPDTLYLDPKIAIT